MDKTNEKSIRAGSALLACGLALMALSGSAQARDNVSLSISFGFPAAIYAPPPPVHVERQVIYAAPQVVYAPPAVVYAPPRVAYYPAPTYYSPAPRWHGHDRSRGRDRDRGYHSGWR